MTMAKLRKKIIEDAVVELIRKAVVELPEDVEEALRMARGGEESAIASSQLDAILENVRLAKKKWAPMCQDTGTITFFVECGLDFPFRRELEGALVSAVRRATEEVPLRPNAVDVFTGKNSGDNTGAGIPAINWLLVNGDECRIIVFPKGAGSENMSALAMLQPGEGIEGVKKFVVEKVRAMGGKPCPPIIVGVGIGGGADVAMKLAKKSLLRKLGEPNKNGSAAALEKELKGKINALGIGPMGLGGNTTCLAVHVEAAHRHPASLPIGLVVQCWADRRASMTIDAEGGARFE